MDNNETYIPVYGKATITIRFENRLQWQKYRKYVLKTNWDFDSGANTPYTASIEERFNCIDDVEKIVKKIVFLMELGFDVYSCNWSMLKQGEQQVEYIKDGELVNEILQTQ